MGMNTIIAGSRSITDYRFLKKVMEEIPWRNQITSVCCGTARGVDNMGRMWAENRGIKVHDFPAPKEIFGSRAEILRNRTMASFATASVILWDGVDDPTANIIEEAKAKGHLMAVYIYNPKTRTGINVSPKFVPLKDTPPRIRKKSGASRKQT
jgi:hypothetical protein